MNSFSQTSGPRPGSLRAPWSRLSTTPVKAQASRQLALEAERLWLLSRRAGVARERGLQPAELDDAIALSATRVILAHRAGARRGLAGRIRARMLALTTFLDEALSDQAEDSTRVSVVHPLQAAPHMGLSRWDLPPGQPPYPYRLAEQELVLVLDGRPTLRTPNGRRELQEGELVVFQPGRDGGHQLVNGTPETVRFLAFSDSGDPEPTP